MTACSDFDLLLSLRAVGALGPVEAPAVEAHLAVCPACRAEADARTEALFLARLPAFSPGEQRAFRELPEAMLRDLRVSGRRRALGKRIAVGFAIAAAAAALVLAPAVLRKGPPAVDAARVAAAQAAAGSTAAWQAPDPETLWEDAGFFEEDSSTATGGGSATDAALAALDY